MCRISTYRSSSFDGTRPTCPSPPIWMLSGRRRLPRRGPSTLPPPSSRVDNGLALIETFDVAFSGFGGDRIRGWLHRPVGTSGPIPAVVEFLGYGGGRGLPHEKTIYAQAGFVHFVMDTRGQGSGWSVGDTADPAARALRHIPGS